VRICYTVQVVGLDVYTSPMPRIQTVRGPIAAEALGFTSLHEHVLCDLTVFRERFKRVLGRDGFPEAPLTLENRSRLRHGMILSPDNLRLDDEAMMTGEVEDFARAGGNAIVETGAPGIRTAGDVRAFARISGATGVHIVACTGLYAEDSWPDRFRGLTTNQYVDYLRGEITEGIGDSGILPGQIKVAYEGRSADADAYLRAACLVSRETGISLQVHVGLLIDNAALRVQFLPLLYDCDPVPEKTVICHVENWLGMLKTAELVRDPTSVPVDLTLHREVLDRGYNVCFTCIGAEWDQEGMGLAHRPDWFYMAGIRALVEAGYAGQITMGHDVFTRLNTRRGGGEGYTRIPRYIVPTLLAAGVGEADVRQMTVENPARLLAF
jgi:phosphotriesterase-related protein